MTTLATRNIQGRDVLIFKESDNLQFVVVDSEPLSIEQKQEIRDIGEVFLSSLDCTAPELGAIQGKRSDPRAPYDAAPVSPDPSRGETVFHRPWLGGVLFVVINLVSMMLGALIRGHQ